MSSVAEVGQAIQRVIGDVSEAVARETGFTQRASKLTGTAFVQTTVLGWLHQPAATLEALSQTATGLGVPISAQGLDQRFTPAAAALLNQVLTTAVHEVIAAEPVAIPLLRRFAGVIVQDSSTVSLPDELAADWPGCGGSGPDAAVKLQVRFDLLRGTLTGPLLDAGRANDRGAALTAAPVPADALYLADLGYFSLAHLQAIVTQGAHFLTRLFLPTAIYDAQDQRLELAVLLAAATTDTIDQPIRLGATTRVPVRLLAVRVPPSVAEERRRTLRARAQAKGRTPSRVQLTYADWTVLVTNLPPERLSLAEALVLARVRWQIELLFKLWKSHGQIDAWRSGKPWRIACELYAKLIAMVLQHWLLLLGSWCFPDHSLVKAAQTVRTYVPLLISALAGYLALTIPLTQIQRCLQAGCRVNRRRQHPTTSQLLLALADEA